MDLNQLVHAFFAQSFSPFIGYLLAFLFAALALYLYWHIRTSRQKLRKAMRLNRNLRSQNRELLRRVTEYELVHKRNMQAILKSNGKELSPISW